MINHSKTLSQLRAKVTKLEQEKELLRAFLHELVEAFYKSVNGNQTKTSTTWTLNPDLEALFKGLSEVIKSCPNCSSKNSSNGQFSFFGSQNNSTKPQPNKCNWEQIKNIFAKMPGEKHE